VAITGCTIDEILPSDNPNEGRVKINNNFQNFCTSFTEAVAAITGHTSVSGGTNIVVADDGLSAGTTYTVNLDENVSVTSLSAGTIVSGSTNLYDIFATTAGGEGLAATLAIGNTTGVNDIEIDAGQALNFDSSGTIAKSGGHLVLSNLTNGRAVYLNTLDSLGDPGGTFISTDSQFSHTYNPSGNSIAFASHDLTTLRPKITLSYSGGSSVFNMNNVSSVVAYEVPSSSGTLALISDISSSTGTSANLWSASTGTNSIIANNGTGNLAAGTLTFAVGYNNRINAGYSASILGGYNNTISDGTWVGTIGGGYNNTIDGSGHLGNVIAGGGGNTSTRGKYSSIGGGYGNSILSLVESKYSIIGGGKNNSVGTLGFGYNNYGIIIGGLDNNVIANNGTIISGRWNVVSGGTGSGGRYSVIGSGWYNTIDARHSIIGSGGNNKITSNLGIGASYSIIGAGAYNKINGTSAQEGLSIIGAGSLNYINTSKQSVIGGGRLNLIVGSDYSSVVGGKNNSAITISNYSFIGGGRNNVLSSSYSSIVGGYNNTISSSSPYSVIAGGIGNTASNYYSSVIGGNSNTASGANSAIGGGFQNLASGERSFVAAGRQNSATTTSSSVIAGSNSYANGDFSAIIAGRGNVTSGSGSFIGGGGHYGVSISHGNLASGDNAGIIGGRANTVSALNSFIGGGSGNTVSGNYSAIIGGSGLTNSFDETVMMNNARLAENGGVIYSAGTDLYSIFSTGGGTGNTLAQTLAYGNETGGSNLIVSNGDYINWNSTGSTGHRIIVDPQTGNNSSTLPNKTGTIAHLDDLMGKYADSIPFTGGTIQTVTHNLGSTAVIVQVINPSDQLIIPDKIQDYTSNTVDIEVSITGTYRVIIIG
jgi:hypothetical protein